ncbi:MAG: transcriptional repressor LexA [Gammaproteobacteria bacterium]
MGNYDVLTRRQRAVLDYLRENEDRFVDAPTLDELCDAMGLSSRGSMHKHVMALIDAGFVEAMDRKQRGVRLRQSDEGVGERDLPLLGAIAAGRPIEAIAGPDVIDVPASLRSAKPCYVLKVRGDSMIEDGILDGDYVVVEQRGNANNGDIVVALIDEEEATLKRILQRPGEVVLCPANSGMEAMHFTPERVRIQGVVVGQMRQY